MIGALISLLVTLLICGVLWWAINAVLGLLPVPEPFGQIIRIILIVILCLIVINALLAFVPGAGGYRWNW